MWCLQNVPFQIVLDVGPVWVQLANSGLSVMRFEFHVVSGLPVTGLRMMAPRRMAGIAGFRGKAGAPCSR